MAKSKSTTSRKYGAARNRKPHAGVPVLMSNRGGAPLAASVPSFADKGQLLRRAGLR
jgi:hypothetical protein